MKLLRRDHVRLTPDQLDQTLEALEAFLRTELSAVESYRVALARTRDRALREALAKLGNSHLGRACLLRERLDEFGGRAASRPREVEAWGAFAPVIERVRAARDDSEMLGALCEGEAWCVKDYEADLNEIDAAIREPVCEIVLPEQRRTHRVMEALIGTRPAGPPAWLVVRRRWYAIWSPRTPSAEHPRPRAH